MTERRSDGSAYDLSSTHAARFDDRQQSFEGVGVTSLEPLEYHHFVIDDVDTMLAKTADGEFTR